MDFDQQTHRCIDRTETGVSTQDMDRKLINFDWFLHQDLQIELIRKIVILKQVETCLAKKKAIEEDIIK